MIAVSLALSFFASDVCKSLLGTMGRLAGDGVDAAKAWVTLGLSIRKHWSQAKNGFTSTPGMWESGKIEQKEQ